MRLPPNCHRIRSLIAGDDDLRALTKSLEEGCRNEAIVTDRSVSKNLEAVAHKLREIIHPV
jgi:hypothetical protein